MSWVGNGQKYGLVPFFSNFCWRVLLLVAKVLWTCVMQVLRKFRSYSVWHFRVFRGSPACYRHLVVIF